MDSETAVQLHRRLGRLLAETPNIRNTYQSTETQMWIGRVSQIVSEAGALMAGPKLEAAKMKIGYVAFNQAHFMQPLYDTLAMLEDWIPAEESHPSFLPAGSPYDAHRIITDIVSQASRDVLIVDRYLRDSVISRFAPSIQEGVSLRLLTTAQARATLVPALSAWNRQHGSSVSSEARVATPREIHDRLVIVDRARAWTLTQSFHDIADSAPAEIIANESNVAEKIEAYESVWDSASPMH